MTNALYVHILRTMTKWDYPWVFKDFSFLFFIFVTGYSGMLTGLIGLVWAVYGHFTQWLSVAFLKAELFLTCHAAFETLSWHTVCMTLQLICIKWNSAQLCRISKGCCHLCCPNSKLSVKMNDMMFNRGVTSLTSVIDLLLFQISSKYIYPSIHPYYIYIY